MVQDKPDLFLWLASTGTIQRPSLLLFSMFHHKVEEIMFCRDSKKPKEIFSNYWCQPGGLFGRFTG